MSQTIIRVLTYPTRTRAVQYVGWFNDWAAETIRRIKINRFDRRVKTTIRSSNSHEVQQSLACEFPPNHLAGFSQRLSGIPTATRNTTALFLFFFVLLGVAWEFYAAFTGGGSATISWTVYSLIVQYPVIGFALGFLCGHLFAPMAGVRVVDTGELDATKHQPTQPVAQPSSTQLLSAINPAKRMLDFYHCSLDKIEGEFGSVIMKNEATGEELSGLYPVRELTANGIEVGDSFVLQTIEQIDGSVRFELQSAK